MTPTSSRRGLAPWLAWWPVTDQGRAHHGHEVHLVPSRDGGPIGPGHPRDRPWTPTSRDVASVMESEESADVVLVGHSYAGRVVTGVADGSRAHRFSPTSAGPD